MVYSDVHTVPRRYLAIQGWDVRVPRMRARKATGAQMLLSIAGTILGPASPATINDLMNNILHVCMLGAP